MPNVINTLLSESFVSFWVVLVVILAERYLPWPDKYHPISFIKLLATGMQAKVLSTQANNIRQQKISGALASVVILLPFCVILAVFKYLSEYPLFFEALMLLVALRFQDISKQTKKISFALSKQKKILARHALSKIVLRETDKMSPLGIAKANIESLLLRFSYQYCSVIFWYLITGGVGALTYRFIYELSLCWNTKLTRFKFFGQPIRHIVSIMQWVPSKFASLSVMMALSINQGSSALFQRTSYRSNHSFILNLCGSSLGAELGGPAYYDNKKVRTSKCGGNKQVSLTDNLRTLTAITQATWIWLTLYFMGCVFAFSITR